MLWKRQEAAGRPKAALCCADPASTRAAADRLTAWGVCECVAVLSDEAQDVVWTCRREEPDILVLEAVPDAMERLDDPTKDITGRCELAVQVTEALPTCRVYLTCAEAFRRLEPVLQKAVETALISGYCLGSPTRQQIERWLDSTSGQAPQK